MARRYRWSAPYAGVVANSAHAGFDHVTVAVHDLEEAIDFFALLGFEKTKAVVVSGEEMSRYMGIPGWEADHVTLTLRGAPSHQEVQLLRFHRPELRPNPGERDLGRPGYNHVCFAVDDLEATLERVVAHGVKVRSGVLEFHDRKLVFLEGPAGVTVELAEWQEGPARR
jgi:catechol 2,3-dioxygenase-like lactoylglutathione lyase family enzyme